MEDRPGWQEGSSPNMIVCRTLPSTLRRICHSLRVPKLVPTSHDANQPDLHESQQRLDQVRDLLFGEAARDLESRVVELSSALADAQTALTKRTNAMRQELDDLRASSMDRAELACALRQLADAVERGANVSAPPKKQ